MAEKRLTRKELLKEPDEFISTSAKVINYTRANPRHVTIAVLALVGCAVIALAWYARREYQVRTSHEMFQQALGRYTTALISKNASSEQWDGIVKEFDKLAKEYGSTIYGELGILYAGHVLYGKNDYQGALAHYSRMEGTSLVSKGLGNLVMYHLAATHQALGQLDKALEIFDGLAKNMNSPYRREAHAAIAKVYLSMKKNKEALQAYRQYLKEFPEAPDAALVRAKIATLSSQG